jgi:hypothetical protein
MIRFACSEAWWHECRRPLGAAPLTPLGITTWVADAVASLSCCCERLSHVDPGYLMGDCLPTSANVLSSVAVVTDER